MMQIWNEKLQKALIQQFGKKKGTALSKKYDHTFPAGYSDDYPVDVAVDDISHIEKLSDDHTLVVKLYCTADKECPLHLRLYQWQRAIPLSDILPMLENLDLRTFSERPHKISMEKENSIWISDFSVAYSRVSFEIDRVHDLFQEAFSDIYFGFSENDGFNKLVLGAALSSREVLILRVYAKYLHQVGFRFSQAYIEKALVNHPNITKDLILLFETRHDPAKQSRSKTEASQIRERILQALDAVTSLDEDRILRRLLDLIGATLRTNYYQIDKAGQPKAYLSLKLKSAAIPELPLPLPLYEIFVYATQFEAIHLRAMKVARGGIRWSERPEDFRTEILGLMKAQKVKNAVIVPSGAKGGFVLKAPLPATRELLQVEVVRAYQAFMHGLLDLTDNIVEGKIIHPKRMVCYDDEDPYLVVAADKGTATFSDIANNISKEYDFWLEDAFASGGRTGYDHKKIGITARGAWESIRRHFRELNVDVMQTPITVVGIGDMSGDVFGNGMIYSKNIKLVAAFDHRHIFIDPNPDTEIAYNERVRLFNLPISSWENYNPELISKGGGVFKRSSKSITLTAAVKQLLNIEENALAPNDLIRAILKAPVDLLFNGGIGTYVKAGSETAIDVGDRTNDYCRVNGGELNCKVVGEGGNLGFTQLGRVEFALKGGLINTDFIDNSAGVDCSDHEVNLKILLNQEVHLGRLSQKKRDALLYSVTQEIAELVLHDNYQQALVMSFSTFQARQNMMLHSEYIKELEVQEGLDRQVEYLPDQKTILERKAAGEGLTRPELAVLLAYTKIHIKHEILRSDIPEDPYLNQVLETAFPASLHKKYQHAMDAHQLRREIVATQLSNQIVNEMGITFVYRLQVETGASVDEIIRAHVVVSQVFGAKALLQLIASLDFKIPLKEQYEMMYNIRQLLSLSVRWFLRSGHLKNDLKRLIETYQKQIQTLEGIIPDLMGGLTKEYLASLTDRFLKIGLSKEMARHIATYRAIYTALNIIEVSNQHKFDLIKTAKVYFAAGEKINLLWFRDQIAGDVREGHWNALARLTLRDELDISQRALTVAIINKDKKETDVEALIAKWMCVNQRSLMRWNKLLELLHGSPSIDYSMFFIAIRELMALIVVS